MTKTNTTYNDELTATSKKLFAICVLDMGMTTKEAADFMALACKAFESACKETAEILAR